MQHLDEGTIHAWIDGALPADEAARVDGHARSCAQCSAMVAEARGFVAGASRIVSELDVTPAAVLPLFGGRKPTRRWRLTRAGTAIAATLVIAVGTMLVRNNRDDPQTKPIATRPILTAKQSVHSPATGLGKPEPVAPTLGVPGSVATTQPSPSGQVAASPAARQPNRVASVAPEVVAAVPGSAAELRAMGAARSAPASAPVASQLAQRPVASQLAQRPAVADSATRIDKPSLAPPPPATMVNADSVHMKQIARAQMPGQMSAASAAGSGGGARARLARGAAASSGVSSDRIAYAGLPATLRGCYELDQPTDVLPKRFALLALPEPAAAAMALEVAYLDSTGAVAGRIPDVSWTESGGRAVVRTLARGEILTIVRTETGVSAQSVLGPRTARVAACR